VWLEPHLGVGSTRIEGNDFATFMKSFTLGARVGYDVTSKLAVAADVRYSRVGWFDDDTMPHAEVFLGLRYAP
jgi:opacity protein-like surface antigen